MRMVAIELGPTFIKFGQLLSNRQDIVPQHIIQELEKLQDRIPPFPFEQVQERIETDFGKPLDSLFLYFYKEPDAAASLAQVHRAILPTGKTVAVKVKRPGIEDQIHNDVHIMYQLAALVDNYMNISRAISAVEVIEEFASQMEQELDFVQELLNVKKFREDFADDPTVVVPEAYDEYNTHNVLVMEFIHAQKVSTLIEQKDPRFDLRTVNERTADFIMNQLFITGFFHADPHPGNFLVLEDNVICFVDFGMVYHLRPYEQENINFMMIGLAWQDSVLVSRSLLRLTRAEGKVDNESFQAAVYDFIVTYLDKPLQYINLSESLVALLHLLDSFGIKMTTRLVYLAKVIGMLEAIGSQLDPDFELLESLKEFSPKIWAKQIASKRNRNRLMSSALNWGDVVLQAPDILRNVGRYIKDPHLRMDMPEVEATRDTMDKIGFRLVFGVVLSALLISSSLIVLADIEPKIHGIPVIGIVGFVIGAVMGVMFLITGFVKLLRWRKNSDSSRF